MNRLPISVCMISGAEAHRISRALASVSAWTAEIIVVLNEEVDDGTEQLAVAHGARVFREPWRGHVEQKNSAAAKASQPWSFGLDADEEVSVALREEIGRVFSKPAGLEHLGYSFPRCTFYCGRWIRHGDWYPDRKVRIWKTGHGRWSGMNPHDRLEVQGSVGRLQGDLWHFSQENLNRQVAKTVVYADAFVRGMRAQGKQTSTWDLVLRPPWRFFRGYVIKRGFLDGWPGFAIAWMTAFYTFLRYARVREEATPVGKVAPDGLALPEGSASGESGRRRNR